MAEGEFQEGHYTTHMPWHEEYMKRQATESNKRGVTESSRSKLLTRLLAKLGARDEFQEGHYTTHMPWYDEYTPMPFIGDNMKKEATETNKRQVTRSKLLKRLLTKLGARDGFPEGGYTTHMPWNDEYTPIPWYDEYKKKEVTASPKSQLLKRLLTALGTRDEFPGPHPTDFEPWPIPDEIWEHHDTDSYDIKK